MAKILIQWTSGIFLIGGTIVAMKQIQDRIMLELWLQVPVITVLTLLVSGFGFILFDILISRLIVPTVRKESRKIVYGSVWSSCCSMQISFHYQVEAFAGSFLRGSVFMTIYYMLLGLKVDHPSKVLFFGQLHDMKNLRISRGSDDIEQGKVAKPFHFVADKRSFFEGHRLEHGTLVFEKVQAIGTVSLHPQAIVMDQTLVDVTIGKQTRVMFTKNVTKNTTGFYYGMPSEECSEPDQNETILQ
jgi:hypothetical protein